MRLQNADFRLQMSLQIVDSEANPIRNLQICNPICNLQSKI